MFIVVFPLLPSKGSKRSKGQITINLAPINPIKVTVQSSLWLHSGPVGIWNTELMAIFGQGYDN